MREKENIMSSHFTEMQIWPAKEGLGKLRGNGQVMISGTVVVKFQVIEGNNGVFASLPRTKGKDSAEGKPQYYQQVKIPDQELYNEFQAMVQETYKKIQSGETPPAKKYQDNAPF